MNRDEMQKLAELSMLQLSADELDALSREIDSILAYVNQLSEVAPEKTEPQAGPVSNVTRPDIALHEPGFVTEAALSLAARRKGQYFTAKKILPQ